MGGENLCVVCIYLFSLGPRLWFLPEFMCLSDYVYVLQSARQPHFSPAVKQL